MRLKLLPIVAAMLLCCSPLEQALAETPTKPTTPNLPVELRLPNSEGKLTLLDFYSAHCGVCLKMEEHLADLKKTSGKQVAFQRVDVSEPQNRKFVEQFNINGTPTYILYDATGKPLYKMDEMISSGLLKLQVFRRTGQLRKITLPTELPGGLKTTLKDAKSSGKTLLLAFQDDECKPCQKLDPFLSAFEQAPESRLAVLRVNLETETGRKFLKSLSKEQAPLYVLMDPDGQELFRHEGEIDPKVLWTIVQSFTDSGL